MEFAAVSRAGPLEATIKVTLCVSRRRFPPFASVPGCASHLVLIPAATYDAKQKRVCVRGCDRSGPVDECVFVLEKSTRAFVFLHGSVLLYSQGLPGQERRKSCSSWIKSRSERGCVFVCESV